MNNGSTKMLIVLITLILTVANTCNAQMMVGGHISFTSSNPNNLESSGAATEFALCPEIGWMLKDNVAVGIRPMFSYRHANSGHTSSGFSIEPYFQYRLLEFHKFGLWTEASGYYMRSKTVETNDEKYFRSYVGLELLPILTYDLTEHLRLQSRLNLFNAGFHYSFSGSSPSLSTSIGASTDDVASLLGEMSIGFMYMF